jgi:hypothetical protein
MKQAPVGSPNPVIILTEDAAPPDLPLEAYVDIDRSQALAFEGYSNHRLGWGGPIEIQPGTNRARIVDGIRYTGHALDQMQGRGIPPSAVENTIQHGVRSPGYDGATVIYDSKNDITVVMSPNGSVKTVHPGGG